MKEHLWHFIKVYHGTFGDSVFVVLFGTSTSKYIEDFVRYLAKTIENNFSNKYEI